MRYFLRHRVPEPSRILLVESGSPRILKMVLPRLQEKFAGVPIDLVTCFPAPPGGLENK